MPSEDAKTATQSVKDEDEDGMSLGSILKDRKNKALNATLASSSKPRPKEVKVKKGEAGGSNDGSDRKKPMKPGSVSVSVSGPGSRVVKVKKEEKVEEDDDDDDDKPISRKMASVKLDKQANVKKKVKQEDVKTVKVEVKRKISTPGSKEVTVKKREKKVYDLPGQKRDPPEERDPLRIFYESLYKQMPRSEMAQFWMMESGLLPKEEAKKVFDKKQRKSQAQKLSSPAKSAVAVQRNSQTLSIKKKDLSSSLSSKKKMDVKTLSKQLKKRKDEDTSFGEDSDDDFVISRTKKQRTAN